MKEKIKTILLIVFALAIFIGLPLFQLISKIAMENGSFNPALIYISIVAVMFVIGIIYGATLSKKEEKYKENNVTEEIINDPKLGKINIEIDELQKSIKLKGSPILMNQNQIYLKMGENMSKESYLEVLRYIESHQQEIEENLQHYYLLDYDEYYVEKNFYIASIGSSTYQELTENKEYAQNYVAGLENLEKLYAHSNENDSFLYVSASCDQIQSSYAFCYINCRTLEMAYWFDMID